MTAYYNEIDPFAAATLQNLIDAGHIAHGLVDTRSIEDVTPNDLAGFTQCHFFAGVGVWSLSLRRAGWADDRPVWTGSCPCQPFSAAGKGMGFADERHLWPAFYHLIAQRRPAVVFGEQVASRDVDPWIDLVQADLEALDYAVGCVPFPSAGVGAPHIRDRAYWVGHADHTRLEGFWRRYKAAGGWVGAPGSAAEAGQPRRLADVSLVGREQGRPGVAAAERDGAAGDGTTGGLVDASSIGWGARWHANAQHDGAEPAATDHLQPGRMAHPDSGHAAEFAWPGSGPGETGSAGPHDQPERRGVLVEGQPTPGPTNGLWGAADWLFCRDGKWRPVEPGTFPLAHGAPSRVGRLRAYGNAINAEAARVFIEAVM